MTVFLRKGNKKTLNYITKKNGKELSHLKVGFQKMNDFKTHMIVPFLK